MKRIFTWIAGGLVVILATMQLIPVTRTNPTITREIKWDSAKTRALAVRACFDCHSNETAWPWYSAIAPASLILSRNVNEGREHLNFSQWDRTENHADEVQEVMEKSKMPPWDYLLLHPEAQLTVAEKEQLLSGLEATFQKDPPPDAGHKSD